MSSTEQRLLEEAGRCINCGFCEAVCPTLPSSGYNSSRGARGRVMLGREMLDSAARGEGISQFADSFFSCLDCYACLQVCPAGVNAGRVSHMARELITGSGEGVPQLARLMERMIMRYHSIVPLGRRASAWAKGLNIPAAGETLLYTGQMYQLMSYSSAMTSFLHGRGKGISRTIVGSVLRLPWLMRLAPLLNDREIEEEMGNSLRNIATMLDREGVKFCYMGESEPYPGTLMHDLGFASSMKEYASFVAGEFRKRGARRVITVDPHTHDLLKNTYPQLVEGFDFEVVHYTELLDPESFSRGSDDVSFHEPCHMTRRFDDFSAPARLLGRVAEVKLPDSSGRKTHCCGGPDELLYPGIAGGVSRARMKQLREAGGRLTVTACPVCLLNLGREGEAMDISDLLVRRMKPGS